MRKRSSRVISAILTLVVLVASMPFGGLVGAADTPASVVDLIALAKTQNYVGADYAVTTDSNGLTITLSNAITATDELPASCDNAATVGVINPGDYAHMLNGAGKEHYVFIPASQLFDVANNQYFHLKVAGGASNSANAAYSFCIWYEGTQTNGTVKYSNRELTAPNLEVFKDQGTVGAFVKGDRDYAGTEFSAYFMSRSTNFKIYGAIVKVIGNAGDSFTFEKMAFGPSTIVSKPLNSVYFAIPSNFNADLVQNETYASVLKLLDADETELSKDGATINYVVEPEGAVTINAQGAITAKVVGDFKITANVTLNSVTKSDFIVGNVSAAVAQKAAAPTASPVAGTYTTAQDITLSTATSGADIYYTTNGTTPTIASTKYTAPFKVEDNTTVKAIAVPSSSLNPYHPATPATYMTQLQVDKVTSAPVIDGVLNDPVWDVSKTTQKVTMNPDTNAVTATSEGAHLFDVKYDDQYLYVGVMKKVGADHTPAPSTKFNEGDNIEIVLDPPAIKGSTSVSITPVGGGAAKTALDLGAAQYFVGYKDGSGANVFCSPADGNPTGTNVVSTATASVKKSGEYLIFESKFSLAALGIVPKNGEYFGLNIIDEGAWTDNDPSWIMWTQGADSIGMWMNTKCTGKAIMAGPDVGASEVATFVYTIDSEAKKLDSVSLTVPGNPTANLINGQTYDTQLKLLNSHQEELSKTGAEIAYTVEPADALTISDTGVIIAQKVGNFKITANVTLNSITKTTELSGTITNSALERVKTPTATPVGGTYTSTQNVTLASETSGATIYYTTNGDVPTTSSTQYTAPIRVSKTSTIRAIAVKSGMVNSEIANIDYTIEIAYPKVATPTADPASGTSFTDTLTVTLGCATEGATLYYTTDGSNPIQTGKKYTRAVTINQTTTLQVVGLKSGVRDSDIASFTYTKGGAVENQVEAPVTSPASGTTFRDSLLVSLSSVTPDAKIYYTLDGSAPDTTSHLYNGTPITILVTTTIKAIAVKEGMLDSSVTSATFSLIENGGGGGGGGGSTTTDMAAIPSANPKAGTYTEAQNVTLSTSTTGATIYYTTDGTTPTTASNRYSSAISVNTSLTIKAIAVKSGLKNSAIATFAYVIKPQDQVPEETDGFSDVSKDDWFYDAVVFTQSKGLFKGVSATQFGPDVSMTRGMFVTVLNRLAGNPTATGSAAFGDVAGDAWYAGSVAWGSENGIVTGTGSDRFAPNESITREQLCVMLMRYAQYAKMTLPKAENAPSFNDDASVSTWAKDAVAALSGAGVVEGKNGGMFDPQGIATRAEVATMIFRFAQLIDQK